jgi:hypothetical protein
MSESEKNPESAGRRVEIWSAGFTEEGEIGS